MSGNPTQSGTEKFQDGNVRVGVFREATKLFAAERISGDTRKKWSDSQPPGDVSSPPVKEYARKEKAPSYDCRKEQVMGNRDKRGREKKKPKKTGIKQLSTPAKPRPEYKPTSPPLPTSQTDEATGE